MAMDFFEHQQRARQRTGFLLFWFLVAVTFTVLALDSIAWLLTGGLRMPLAEWVQEPWCFWVTTLSLAVILAGSLASYFSLRGGGSVLAKSVGARRVLSSTVEPRERQLLNVVEEMAIASGTPMPGVWIMDTEPGINAFVAGFEPTQAVLVITRGGLDAFDREELQGVVGHEFSHILNGDMRLNVQLYAILSGVLLIGKLGGFLLRNAADMRGGGDSDKFIPAIAGVGLVLYVVGYAGLFCGRLIKAAISRQREFLADASSVQFTRNPQGIGEALLTIRNAGHGSLLRNSHAEDLSHMCLALPVNIGFAGLLATHPPLDARIRAIDPALLARDRARIRLAAQQTAATRPGSPAISGLAGDMPAHDAAASGAAATATIPLTINSLASTVGHPMQEHHERALRLRDSLPGLVRHHLQSADGAQAVIHGLLIANQGRAHELPALQLITATDNESQAELVRLLLPALRGMGTRLHLPCLDMALPTLRALPLAARQRFLATLGQLAQLDANLSLREYIFLSLLRKHLAGETPARRRVRHRSYRTVADPLNLVFSLLCQVAGGSAGARVGLHARLLAGYGVGALPLLPPSALDANRLHTALAELADLSPLLKRPLLDSCLDAVRHDGRVQIGELELVRGIGEALDCPVPPLVG